MIKSKNKSPSDLVLEPPAQDVAEKPLDHRVPLLLFSGGWDSTYMLHLALQETDVEVLSVRHGYNLSSRWAEEKARGKILDYLHSSKDYRHKVIGIWSAGGQEHLGEMNSNKLEYAQLFYHLQYLFDQCEHDRHSSVMLGFLMQDSTALVHDRIQVLWAQMWAVFRPSVANPPSLKLPLALHRKRNVVELMPVGLKKLVWSCNSPYLRNTTKGVSSKPCGICESCVDVKNAMNDLTLTEKRHKRFADSLAFVKQA